MSLFCLFGAVFAQIRLEFWLRHREAIRRRRNVDLCRKQRRTHAIGRFDKHEMFDVRVDVDVAVTAQEMLLPKF